MVLIISKKRIYFLFFLIYFIILSLQSFQITPLKVINPIHNKRTIVIDPGHGGIDGGTNVGDLLEKEINLEIGLRLKQRLEEYSNLKVIMTREEDTALDHLNKFYTSRHLRDLKARVDIIKQVDPDLFISLHVDYRPQQKYAQGPIILYSKRHPKNKVLAATLQKHLNRLNISTTQHQVKNREDLYLLKINQMPGVIMELGFFSNREDRRNLQQEKYQRQLVEAIYKGVEEYFSSFKFLR